LDNKQSQLTAGNNISIVNGVISATGGSEIDLYDGVDSTSATTAATANSVKTAYDKAEQAQSTADEKTTNAADSYLLNRENHTGTQAISSISGLSEALDNKQSQLTAGNNISIEDGVISVTGGSGDTTPIDGGGTGATTAPDARANLDVYSKEEVDTAITTSMPTVADATTIDKGIVRLATESDITNSSEEVAVTPKNVNDMLIGVGALAKGFRALFSARLTTMTGTNTSNDSTITATITAHGLAVGDVINITFGFKITFGSSSTTSTVTVTSVPNANTFVFVGTGTGSGSGYACTLNYVLKSKYNINSLTINAVGRYTIAINTASGITGTSFIPLVAATTLDNSPILIQPEVIASATSLTVRTFDKTGVAITPQWLHIGVTQ
jgi:hypothetical protein